MSIFYCEICHRNEDSDWVGYVQLRDGREVCQDAADELAQDRDEEDPPPVRKVFPMRTPKE